jgi:glycosyltransferase involved in cell wall biosynthesis
MNILCISKYASPPKYGVAARLFYLAKEMVREGHYVTLMTSDSNHLAKYPDLVESFNREHINGVDTIWFKNSKYSKTASVSRILSWLSFEYSLFSFPKSQIFKPDVIIVSSLSLFSVVYGYYLKRYFKVPLVFEVRDIWPLTLVAEGGVSRWNPLSILMGAIEKFAYKKADLIVGTMPKLDLHVKKILGYYKECFCSPLGFDSDVMEERSHKENTELKSYFPINKTVVGYAGSMGISNNLDTFIGTIFELRNNASLHFVLVGAGDLREKYEAELDGVNNVTFVPRISPSEVPAFLNQCDILYLSTHNSEVWDYGQSMNKVVEYMYAGKPIIASYSGFPSMINESDCGVFVKPNDKCSLVLEFDKIAKMDSADLKSVGDRGAVWIKENRCYKVLSSQYITRLKMLLHN